MAIGNVKTLVNDFETMAHEHTSGHYKHMVDETKHEGAFADLANRLNSMTDVLRTRLYRTG
jgi:hypothetical protein